uniref:Uncharacterized protein n=1 Tax=Timema monikensis TaxID=170555 RepID=A0A7R9E9B1_9NEOP|nr:unnamed protein product [Timema monikensis]
MCSACTGCSTSDERFAHSSANTRSLVNQEEKFKQQLAELNDQLTASDTERNKLLYQMEELQRDVIVKNSGVDRELDIHYA